MSVINKTVQKLMEASAILQDSKTFKCVYEIRNKRVFKKNAIKICKSPSLGGPKRK